MSVKVGSLGKGQGEYTRNLEEGRQKLRDAAEPLAGGDPEKVGNISKHRTRPLALDHLHPPLNPDQA
jgi:hypothetical protein